MLLLVAFWAHFSHFFALGGLLGASWATFWRNFLPSRVFDRFFRMLDRFLEVFGRFSEGFGEDFSMFFGAYIEKRDFVKISVSPHRGHENQGFELSAYNKKSMKNRLKIDANLELENNS